MGRFCQFFYSVICPQHYNGRVLSFGFLFVIMFLFIFGICIDNEVMWFGIVSGQILSIFYSVICPQHYNGRVLSFDFLFVIMFLFIFCIFTFLGSLFSKFGKNYGIKAYSF